MIFASREVVKANLQNQDFLSGERRANRSRQPTRRSVARSAEWIWQNNVMCPYDGSNCPGTFFALTANWWRRLETVQHLYAFRRSERWNSSMLNKHAPFSPSRSRFSRHYSAMKNQFAMMYCSFPFPLWLRLLTADKSESLRSKIEQRRLQRGNKKVRLEHPDNTAGGYDDPRPNNPAHWLFYFYSNVFIMWEKALSRPRLEG